MSGSVTLYTLDIACVRVTRFDNSLKKNSSKAVEKAATKRNDNLIFFFKFSYTFDKTENQKIDSGL